MFDELHADAKWVVGLDLGTFAFVVSRTAGSWRYSDATKKVKSFASVQEFWQVKPDFV